VVFTFLISVSFLSFLFGSIDFIIAIFTKGQISRNFNLLGWSKLILGWTIFVLTNIFLGV